MYAKSQDRFLSREYFPNTSNPQLRIWMLHAECPRFHLHSRYSSFEFSVRFDGEEDGTVAITRDGDNSRFSRPGKVHRLGASILRARVQYPIPAGLIRVHSEWSRARCKRRNDNCTNAERPDARTNLMSIRRNLPFPVEKGGRRGRGKVNLESGRWLTKRSAEVIADRS